MHLVTPLMTGVRGAKNGTVFCYERGTETPAPVYADASGKVRRHGVVRLDALGSVALYVDRLVDVLVYSSSSALVREWTDGRSAGAVVVESDAFTGVDYETGLSGVGERTTMAEALNRWLPSAGAVDFNMLVNAEVRPVYVAIGDMAGAFFDVREYGARGDNSGDDLGPIQAAIGEAHAAGGGIVYLSAGRYRISDAISLYEGVSLMGDNSASTFIVSTNHEAAALHMLGTDDPAPTHSVTCLAFSVEPAASLLSSQPLIFMAAGSAVVTDCYFNGASNADALVYVQGLQKVRITNCIFRVVNSTSSAIKTDTTFPVKRLNVDNCGFIAVGTRATALVGVSRLHLEGCSFNLTGISSGNAECIALAGEVDGMVDGCDVTGIGGGGVATLLVATTLDNIADRVFEDCSLMDATNRLYDLVATSADASYYSRLKTVETRHAPLVEDAVAVNSGFYHVVAIDASQYGVFSVYNKSAVAVAAPESTVFVGVSTYTAFSPNMNLGRTLDVLFFCVTQDGFNILENRHRNSVVPRWNFKANSLFAFRMMSARAPATVPSVGDMTRLHCLSCSASPATVVVGEREGYGPI